VALIHRWSYRFLITIGGCHYLDGLKKRGAIEHHVVSEGSSRVLVRGSPHRRSRRATLMDCSRVAGVVLIDWLLAAPTLRVKLE
jgi:hypothetical protein